MFEDQLLKTVVVTIIAELESHQGMSFSTCFLLLSGLSISV